MNARIDNWNFWRKSSFSQCHQCLKKRWPFRQTGEKKTVLFLRFCAHKTSQSNTYQRVMLRRFVPPLGGFPYFPSLLLEVPPRMHKRWRPSSTSWIWSVHVEMLQPMGGVVKEDALNRPYARTTSYRTICKVLKIAGKLKRILSLWDYFSSILETRIHWRSSLMLWESSFWIKEKAPFAIPGESSRSRY